MVFLQMMIFGAALILLVALFRKIALNRLPKDTFLILWGIVLIRLLVPVSIPSAYSVYGLTGWEERWKSCERKINDSFLSGTSADMADREILPETVGRNGGILPSGEVENGRMESVNEADVPAGTPENVRGWESIIRIGWFMGAGAFLLFFMAAYLCGLFRFRTSLPVQEEKIEKWLREHPLRRSISVRQSDRLTAPLTYGIWHPIILLPKKTDWSDTARLEYILLHEYVHIRRFDMAGKLIAALAFCVHWFNPFVWGMYVLFNRDLELSCDEKVVRQFGETGKAAYARTLIAMAAEQSGLAAFGNYFGQNAVEERIVSIMKWKKVSFFKKLLSTALVIGIASVFVFLTLTVKVNAEDSDILSDMVSEKENKDSLPDAGFTEEEYAKLTALQFDGYEDMTVAQYQEKVWEYTDTAPYRNLLERFSQSETLYVVKDDNEIAAFLFYVLEPLTAERWQERDFGGCVLAPGNSVPGENAMLEYEITLCLKKPDALTVREYDNARKGMMSGFAVFLQGRTKEQLQDESYMEQAILTQIDLLSQKWSTEALEIQTEFAFMPLTPEKEENISGKPLLTADAYDQGQEEARQEPRINGYATEEDYRSLLALRTAGYQQLSTAEFNALLLDWGNAHFDAYERIREDYYRNDYRVELSDEEFFFIGITMEFSGEENYRMIQGLKTGRPEEMPRYRSYLMEKETSGGIAWCGLDYEFSYRISDRNMVTVAERDEQLYGVICAIGNFWEETSLEELLSMTKEDVLRKLDEIAAEYSSGRIVITIEEDELYFEGMDERTSVGQ